MAQPGPLRRGEWAIAKERDDMEKMIMEKQTPKYTVGQSLFFIDVNDGINIGNVVAVVEKDYGAAVALSKRYSVEYEVETMYFITAKREEQLAVSLEDLFAILVAQYKAKAPIAKKIKANK